MFTNRYRSKSRTGVFFVKFARSLRWTLRILLVLLITDLFYLTLTWPAWDRIAATPIPKSSFILEYEMGRKGRKHDPPLRWRPVPLADIPKHVARAVIVAEDSRFYEHSGFDLIAFKEAMSYNLEEGKFVLGASTISQQTVKNLFLNSSRNPLRKWHELVLTWGMERKLSKKRIMALYLNIVELGQGIYGVEAAARAYWNIPAARLSVVQAAELAATLPSPVKHNPRTRTQEFQRRWKKILALLIRFPGQASDTIRIFEQETVAVVDAEDRG